MRAKNSSSVRVLPIPASPAIVTSCPRPAAAARRLPSSASISAARPTKSPPGIRSGLALGLSVVIASSRWRPGRVLVAARGWLAVLLEQLPAARQSPPAGEIDDHRQTDVRTSADHPVVATRRALSPARWRFGSSHVALWAQPVKR